MKRAKVCHIMHDGSGQGGGATFALAYFPGYCAEFDTFAVVGSDGNLAERLRERGVRTLTLPMARPVQGLFSCPRLLGILRRERPDVVVVHGQWAGFFGSIAARLAGVPVVLYVTHFPSFYVDWDFGRILRNRLAESVTCRNATRVVCLSSAGRYQYLLRKLGPEDKFVHISNGLDPAALTEAIDPATLRAELGPGFALGDQLVVSVGRLVDQKRIDWLLKAWALVEPVAPKAHLAIIGTGPEEAALHRLAAELQLKRCHFLGARPNGYRYFRAADCGVICSLYEGQPLALIEAMFVGCPMVGTIVDGIGETIVDLETGLLVPPGDPPALAKALTTLLADPATSRRMGEAAKRRADQMYHLCDILRKHLDLTKENI